MATPQSRHEIASLSARPGWNRPSVRDRRRSRLRQLFAPGPRARRGLAIIPSCLNRMLVRTSGPHQLRQLAQIHQSLPLLLPLVLMVARVDGLHLPVECRAELARELIDRQAINPLFAPTPPRTKGDRQNTLRQSSPSDAQPIQHVSATRGKADIRVLPPMSPSG
jgi:hypothetical protein